MNVLLLLPGAALGGDTVQNAVCSTMDVVPHLKVTRLDPLETYSVAGQAGLYRRINEVIRAESIDVLFYALGREFIFHPHFFAFECAPCFTVMHVGDDETLFDISHRYYAQSVDLVITGNPLIERYRLYGAEAIYAGGGFSAEHFRPVDRVEKVYGVSFVGRLIGKPGRQHFIDALRRSHIDVAVYGYGTPAGIVSDLELVRIYRQSKINLNFTGINYSIPHDLAYRINERIRSPKGRCQQIAMCGAFALSQYAPGIERVFNVGSEIDVFKDTTELIGKVRFYLQRDELREQMARAAYDHAMRRYEARAYWTRLFEDISQRILAGRRPNKEVIYLDPPFRGPYGSYRLELASFFLFSGRVRLLWSELKLLCQGKALKPSLIVWHMRLGFAWATRISPFASKIREIYRYARRLVRDERLGSILI